MRAVHWAGCAALALATCLPAAAFAAGGTLTGTVESAGSAISGATVTLYRAGKVAGGTADALGTTTTDASGAFQISYTTPGANDVIYAVARQGTVSGTISAGQGVQPTWWYIALAAMLGRAGQAPAHVVVNELTTVGTAYAMAQFSAGADIAGPSPGLQNAADTVGNLVNVRSGRIGAVLNSPPNGAANSSRAEFNSLANLLAACVGATTAEPCQKLTQLSWSGRGPVPADTLRAIQQIARNPANNVPPLFKLSLQSGVYQPALDPKQKPDAWTLAIRYVGNGHEFDGPGNIGIDRDGNLWISNNYVYSRKALEPACGSKIVSKLTPTGQDAPGAPFTGGGLNGQGFGSVVDRRGNVWVGNFGFQGKGCTAPPPGNSVSVFTSDGTPLSGDTGYTQGDISGPQGIAVDQVGNVWIANERANAAGKYSVTKIPLGNPVKAVSYALPEMQHPFGIAVDGGGTVWVTNVTGGTVLRLSQDGKLIAAYGQAGTPSAGMITRPLGVAVDSQGNVWVANSGGDSVTLIRPNGVARQFFGGGLQGPWGISVDGEDHVFVSDFVGEHISELCGARVSACPPGLRTGDPISPPSGFTTEAVHRVTGIQIDPSGNVWVPDNWKTYPVQTNPGQYGVVEFIGLGSPVKTPVIGPPQSP